ncbi:MAG: putative enzyme related to lactoylglutathione lyase [Planctomycetota bacterium]|jgi:predicted enzyme related to lactoylglutathione lyase
MNRHEKLNYLEFPVKDFDASKTFFASVFGWIFTDYGPDYCAFDGAGLDGGFYRSELHSNCEQGAALLVFYSQNLEATQEKIEKAGGKLIKPIYSFPGGRRFNFCEPSGNEFAVWSQ